MRNSKTVLMLCTWLVLMVAAAWQAFSNTIVITDVSSFMPAAKNSEQKLLFQQLQNGSSSHLWMILVSGDSETISRQSSQLVTAQLRNSGLFSYVLNGPKIQSEGIRKMLFEYRYLLDPAMSESYFSTAALQQVMEQRIKELASPFSTFSKIGLRSDPTASIQSIAANIKSTVWYDADSGRSLILASTLAQGMDVNAQAQARSAISVALAQLDATYSEEAIVSGAPAFAVAAKETIRSESQWLSIVASLFILLFMFLVFRNGKIVVLTALPLIGGLLVGTAVVSLLFGSIHGITLAFGITLLGVAIDYPVHLFVHARSGEAITKTATRIWPVLRLSALTTALGYMAMAWTDFQGISQLGIFSLVGLLTAALIVNYLLPVLVIKTAIQSPRWYSMALYIIDSKGMRLSGIAMVVFVVISMFISTLLFPQKIWSDDVAALSPVAPEMIEQDRQLRTQLGIAEVSHVVVVTGADIESVLHKQEQLKPFLDIAIHDGYLAQAQFAANYLPSVALQLDRQALLPDMGALRERIDIAIQGLPVRKDVLKPFVEAVIHSKQLTPLRPSDLQDSAFEIALDNLLVTTSTGALGWIQLVGLTDPKKFSELIRGASLPGIRYIDSRSGVSGLIAEYRAEIIQRIGWGSVLITLVLALALRDIARLLRVLIPVFLAVAFSGFVILWSGESLNLFHLVSLLLVAGLGIDYALFFTSIQRNRDEIVPVTLALLICSISTFTVFVMLALSTIPVLHAIGTTVATGVLAAFILTRLMSGPYINIPLSEK